ncbi:MAG: hypothetical protein NT007_06270 [Candidatus Kapabacteria bacterium]|nr:hypothetical protein [Candidatus Kapabacteria bacterium]
MEFIKRHLSWILLGLVSLVALTPGIAELKTLLLIGVVESLAIALSGLSAYAYTKIDFTDPNLQANVHNNLGFIFLGVHICVGLSVLGVYIAQFAN